MTPAPAPQRNTRGNPDDGLQANGVIEELVSLSRLLGRDHALVLHGGGNTSAKARAKNLLGEEETLLYVKGSGASLEDVTAASFAPVRLDAVLPLLRLDDLDTLTLLDACRARMARADAPAPSVETLLHAALPHRFVAHTHADNVLAVLDTPHPERHIAAAFGETVRTVPYRRSGFQLAKACAREIPHLDARHRGLLLRHHGVFTFGDTARQAHERMMALVNQAEAYLCRQGAWELAQNAAGEAPPPHEFAALRHAICRAAGFPLLLTHRHDAVALAFARRDDVAEISQRGPATPHHAVFTKRVPMLGRDVAAFTRAYRVYLAAAPKESACPDAAPRVVLDPHWGLCAAGINAHAADATAEIYRHDLEIIARARALDDYQALPAEEILAAEIEYGGFETKLRARRELSLLGEVVLVNRAASPLGKAVVAELLCRGAAVVGVDGEATALPGNPAYLGLAGGTLADGLACAVHRYGGVDAVVAIEDSEGLEALKPLLDLAPQGARAVLLASRAGACEKMLAAADSLNLRANALQYGTAGDPAARLAAELAGPLFFGVHNLRIHL